MPAPSSFWLGVASQPQATAQGSPVSGCIPAIVLPRATRSYPPVDSASGQSRPRSRPGSWLAGGASGGRRSVGTGQTAIHSPGRGRLAEPRDRRIEVIFLGEPDGLKVIAGLAPLAVAINLARLATRGVTGKGPSWTVTSM